MQRILAILFILITIAGTLHFSVATHYCGGELADVSIAPGIPSVGCGMEEEEDNCPLDASLNNNCCSDQIFLSPGLGNFVFNPFNLFDVLPQISVAYFIPLSLNIDLQTHSTIFFYRAKSPPGDIAQRLSFLQIYRF